MSTVGQSLEVQEAALQAARCDVIRAEKGSGTSTTGREELKIILNFIRTSCRTSRQLPIRGADVADGARSATWARS